jgi:putative DNA primase/helicase
MSAAPNLEPAPAPDEAMMRRHLELIIANETKGLVEIAYTGTDGGLKHARLFPVAALADAAAFAARQNANHGVNVYVGAALRREDAARDRRAKATDVLGSRVLWFDADQDAKAALDAAIDLGAKPTVAVRTGEVPELRHHGYWQIPELLTDHARMAALLKAIAARLGTDRAVTDPPRVLRLAGGVAWPLKPRRVPELVTYLRPRAGGWKASLESLEGLFGAASEPTRSTPALRSTAAPVLVTPAQLADLADALKAIDASDYQVWQRMGHALKTLGDDGHALWHDWSATSEAYDIDEAERKWVSFTPERTGYPAIFAEAKRCGWVNPKSRMATAGQAAPSEEALALRFAQENEANLRYCAAWERWMQWDGVRWAPDKTFLATDYVRDLCRRAAEGADSESRAANNLGMARTVRAVEYLARTDRRLAASAEEWDSDPWLLNTPSGVVDLKTGEIRDPAPAFHMTKVTGTAAGGDCPTWMQFLRRITDNDLDLQSYLQRVLGYALTGDTSEHALFFGYGTGSNGKSVLIDTAAAILGDYHRTAPIETFTESRGDRHPTELAMLMGARLVTSVETEEGRRWAESRIKTMTGGDRVSARFMRQDFFEYDPQFKLLIAGNHKPGLRSVDEAMRRRLHLIPFAVTIPKEERDPKLKAKLKAEWPGILAWMIEGCREWQLVGLAPPPAVRAATEAYMEAEDALSAWIDEKCERDPQAWAASTDLFASWSGWASARGEEPGNARKFAQALESRLFHPRRTTHARGFSGLRLKAALDFG